MFILSEQKKKMLRDPEFPLSRQFNRNKENIIVQKAGYVKSTQKSVGGSRLNEIKVSVLQRCLQCQEIL
jgi:hypothetical protein